MTAPTPAIWPQEPVTERISYLTDVIVNRYGREQRIQARAYPRRALQASYIARGDTAAQLFEHQLMAYRAAEWLVPCYPEFRTLESIPGAGATSVSVDTSGMTLVAGDKVLLRQSEELWVAKTVQALDATSVTFDTALGVSFAAEPGVMVCPLHQAILYSSPKKERQPGRPDTYDVEWFFTLARDFPSDVVLPQYLGLDAMVASGRDVQRLYLGQRQPVTYTRAVSMLDFDTGVVTVYDPAPFTAPQVELSFIEPDRDTALALRTFLATRRGKAVPFWAPTHDLGFDLAQTADSTSLTLVVQGCGFQALDGHETRKHIVLETLAGSRFLRQVQDITAGEGGTEVLHINQALGETVAPAQVRMLCWLGLHRLDSDTVEITWRGHPAAECTVMALEVAQ